MAHARRLIYNGNLDTSADYRPIVGGVEKRIYIAGTNERIPYWVDANAWYPQSFANMTGYTTPSPYHAWASSEYSSSYQAWRAFNGSFGDAYGWVAASADTAPWLSFSMTTPLKDVYFDIYNRTRSSLVNGPISGDLIASDYDGGYVQIGTFSGLPGATSGAGTRVTCWNHNDAFTFFRFRFTNWSRKDQSTDKYLAVGEIYIRGKIAT